MNAFMSFLGPQLPRVSHVYAREHAMRLTVEIYILYIGSYEKTFAVEIAVSYTHLTLPTKRIV